MNQPTPAPADVRAPHNAAVARVELIISLLLRIGVMTSLAIILIGVAVSFIRHPDYMRDPGVLKKLTNPATASPDTITDMLHGLRDLRGQSIVVLGLLVLIATPVMRVGISIFAFVYEGDRTFVIITSTVFLLLLVSFLLGKVE